MKKVLLALCAMSFAFYSFAAEPKKEVKAPKSVPQTISVTAYMNEWGMGTIDLPFAPGVEAVVRNATSYVMVNLSGGKAYIQADRNQWNKEGQPYLSFYIVPIDGISNVLNVKLVFRPNDY